MITEEQQITIEQADRVLRADYWSDVRNVVESLSECIEAGEVTDEESADTWLHETIDGHSRVIYTWQAMQCLLYSDNDGAFEEYVTDGIVQDGAINWSLLAYCALRADVMDEIGDLEEFVEEHTPDEDDSL